MKFSQMNKMLKYCILNCIDQYFHNVQKTLCINNSETKLIKLNAKKRDIKLHYRIGILEWHTFRIDLYEWNQAYNDTCTSCLHQSSHML